MDNKKEATYFLNVDTNNCHEKKEDLQINQVGSRSPAIDEYGNKLIHTCMD